MGAPANDSSHLSPEADAPGRLVVVANRLPVRWVSEERGWQPSPGGLVSALGPVLEARRGSWVGWPGVAGSTDGPFTADGVEQIPVSLSTEEVDLFYEGFCNGTIWPLYHDAIRPVDLHRHWWRPYVDVNQRFAEAVAEAAGPDDPIWVHDYQLQLVPGMLRRMGVENRIGFFLHIPFPPAEIFGRLPWREQILDGLLGADVLGFQTRRGQANFGRAVRSYTSATGPAEMLSYQGRTIVTETVPIGIDAGLFRDRAQSDEACSDAKALRTELGDPDTVILGVDRLDYTKGIDQRLKAFETLLANRPDLEQRVVFVQVAVPSRANVGEYQTMREDIERIVGRINGNHGGAGWVPVHYYYRSLDRNELIAHYLAADIMLVTPLRDGMNLVAKEYVSSRVDGTGTLILSEFAGAAETMSGASIVNPYDVDALADAIGTAIDSDVETHRAAMRTLSRRVGRWDVHRWAAHCIESIEGASRAPR